MEKVTRVICKHCGYAIIIQPPKESGCNHAYYPEACQECSFRSRKTVSVITYDISTITFEVEVWEE